jgi:glycosyltransferase involved in cell wall biosynthesis
VNILFLFPYPIGESPSQRFRFEQYFSLLESKDIHIQSQSFWDIATWKVLYLPGHAILKSIGLIKGFLRRFYILFQLKKYDFVFIHRECAPVGPPLIEWLITKIFKKRVIYDFDDAIWLHDERKESFIQRTLKWRSKVASICAWSFRVSCGNNYLKSFALKYNSQAVFNPTTIDTDFLHNPVLLPEKTRSENKVVIGWTGSHSTLKYLHQMSRAVKGIMEKYTNTEFIVIADQPPVLDFKFRFIPWNKETEIVDLFLLDIGIMPLPDDDWSKGKCGFKALQYMALKIPALVSPVGVNTKIIDEGINGFLCRTPDEWQLKLEYLIQNPALREKMGLQGKQKVEEYYSVTSNSPNFLSLFE